jgi:hypothetical protein
VTPLRPEAIVAVAFANLSLILCLVAAICRPDRRFSQWLTLSGMFCLVVAFVIAIWL